MSRHRGGGAPRAPARRNTGALALGVALGLLAPVAAAEEPERKDEPSCAESGHAAGCFLDIDGVWKSPGQLYDERQDAMDPFHLLTLGEELAFLGAGIAWYAADEQRNLADWDFPSWEQRFTLDAWTFDNNHFPINWIGHPLSGSAYYAFPRANDHAVWVAFTYSFMTSFVWEFLVEFREKVSVNDLIATPVVGLVVGEFAHKLWRYFSGVPEQSSTLQDVLAVTLGFPIWARNAIDGRPQHVAGPYDELGYSNQIGRRLDAGYRVRVHDVGDTVTTHNAWLGGRFSSIPGEGRPGDFALFFHEADIVEGWVSAGVGRDARDWELVADTHVLGLYSQRLDLEGNGDAGVLGLSLGYHYRFQNFEDYNDRLGILHLPGLGADYTHQAGSTRLEVSWRLSGDFGGLHAMAYPEWLERRKDPDDREKTVLRKHKYYYAWGLSSRFGADLTLGPLDVRAGANLGIYDSHDGLDRSQAELTIDPELGDRLIELDTEVGLTVPSTRFRFGAGYARMDRRSHVEDIVVRRTRHTFSLSLGTSL